MVRKLRPPLKEFAQVMESILQGNDHKGGWEDTTYDYLTSRLVEEVGELLRALETNKSKVHVTAEAADVANFAMMIADNYAHYE